MCGVGAIFHGISQNGVTVIIVQDEEILVASTGRDGKSAGEIGGDLSCHFDGGGKDMVCFGVLCWIPDWA